MRMSYHLLAVALLTTAAPSLSQSLPLNTGFDHGSIQTYPLPTSGPVRDNYWIEVAASAAPVPEPAFVVPNAPWAAPMVFGTGSRWISGTANRSSYPGTSAINPSYSIFRKCFCLMRGFQNPQINFRLRSDNAVQVWLNSQLNPMLGPSPSNFNGPVHVGGTSDPSRFRAGRNCVYVLVEDDGVIFGFNLHGTVTALGLMPTAAAGTDMSFHPCACDTPTGSATVSATTNATELARRSRTEADDDSEVIAAIVKIAEQRLRARSAK